MTPHLPIFVLRSLALAVFAGLLTSCGHVWQEREDFVRDPYDAQPIPTINGATVFPQLEPTGGEVGLALNAMVYFAGSETATGPYQIRIVGHGKPGVHATMTVRELRLHAPYGAVEQIPYSMLGNPVPFEKTTDASMSQAIYLCPLAWDAGDFQVAGPGVNVEVEAEVVGVDGRSQTRSFRTLLKPQVRKQRNYGSVAGELWRAAGRKDEIISAP